MATKSGRSRSKSPGITDPVAKELVAQFQSRIRRNDDIVRESLQDILAPYLGDVEHIKANISRIVTESEARAYQNYKDAQLPALSHAIETVFANRMPDNASAAAAVKFIASNAIALDQFFLSVSQGRKSRAGTAVETFFDALFRSIGYPFERDHVVNGTPDFVFPSVIQFRKLPTDCIIFTCKRTLRERWRQITSEGSRGFVLFLGTLDKTIKANDLEDIKNQKIMLVVPEAIRVAHYTNSPHVISIERFLLDHLDAAMRRWKRNGVLPVN